MVMNTVIENNETYVLYARFKPTMPNVYLA